MLSSCLSRLIRVSRGPLSASLPPVEGPLWERPDVHAGGTLGAAHEYASSLLAEAAARRSLPANALARHLWEHEIELAWILAAPSERLRRKWAEESRNVFERLPLHWQDYARAEGLGDVEAVLPAVREALGRKHPDGVWPSYSTMAEDLGRGADWAAGYPAMSWQAHPGLSGVGRHIEATTRAVRFVQRKREDDTALASALAQGASSFASIVALAAVALDVELTAEHQELDATVRLLRFHLNEWVSAARQLRASERQ